MKTAIIIPAYNESQTIAQVMEQFHAELPDAALFVVDNNSTDDTATIALKTYAKLGCRGHLISEPRQGKAMAVRTAFQSVDADIFIMVDADCTYPVESVHEMIKPVADGTADMVVGDRLSQGHYGRENKRRMHATGNRFVRWLLNWLYKASLQDILSGYRVFSRRFVDTFPVLCTGFELEANLTLHSLDKRLRITEVPIKYVDRPHGSTSKLRTVHDGIRVLMLIFNIFRIYRPMVFFGFFALICFLASIAAGILPVLEYIQHRYIYRVPLAVLASAFGILSVLFMSIALILDGMSINHRIEFEYHLGRHKNGRTQK